MDSESTQSSEALKDFSNALLRTGSMLLSSGANIGRIRMTLNRIAGAYGYMVEVLVAHRSIMIAVYDDERNDYYDVLKRVPFIGVNFNVISGISRMSWRIVDERWSVAQILAELDRLDTLKQFSRWQVLLFVPIAGAAFCRIGGGQATDLLIAFPATFVGLCIRHEAVRLRFNTYISVYFGAFSASLFSGFFCMYLGWGAPEHNAFYTSVLFLIPGVPFINSIMDLMDGNTLNGVLRGINGLIHALAIGTGLLTSTIIYSTL